MQKINALEIGQRIKTLIKDRGLKQTEFCELTGMSRNTLTNYIAGERIPDTKYIYIIAKTFDTTIEHILTGELQNIEVSELSKEEQKLLQMYNKLTEKNKGKTEMFIEQKLEEQNNDIKSSVSPVTNKVG